MSDGGDMNWTLHVFGATYFFVVSLYMILQASAVYRKLWSHKHFCPKWSYQLKKYANFIVGIFIISSIQSFIDIGSFVEWAATFYLIIYFISLRWDCKDM